MSDKRYPVPAAFAAQTHIDEATYQSMYRRSVEEPDAFWAEQAETFLTWYKPWDKVSDCSFDADDLHIRWFEGGKLNVTYNCIDRHLDSRADQTAIIWEGDDPNDDKKISFRELHEQVSKLANVLKARGVKKGDRVCIYMPMIPEAG
ncbi:MAG: AMP-binding protein, partial [Gammaproteobacteria bacterium]|nr:AMP-binding protein [Gammaproteobacteria bacterium]